MPQHLQIEKVYLRRKKLKCAFKLLWLHQKYFTKMMKTNWNVRSLWENFVWDEKWKCLSCAISSFQVPMFKLKHSFVLPICSTKFNVVNFVVVKCISKLICHSGILKLPLISFLTWFRKWKNTRVIFKYIRQNFLPRKFRFTIKSTRFSSRVCLKGFTMYWLSLLSSCNNVPIQIFHSELKSDLQRQHVYEVE